MPSAGQPPEDSRYPINGLPPGNCQSPRPAVAAVEALRSGESPTDRSRRRRRALKHRAQAEPDETFTLLPPIGRSTRSPKTVNAPRAHQAPASARSVCRRIPAAAARRRSVVTERCRLAGRRRAHSRRSVSNGFRSRSPREVVNAEDVGDVEAVAADVQPVARGELDNLDGPAARGAVAVAHLAVLSWPGRRDQRGSCCACGF